MIHSKIVNIFILVLGVVFLVLTFAILVLYPLANESPRPSPVGPAVFFGILGAWCTIGAIVNLRRPRGVAPEPGQQLKSYRLLRWNGAILVTSVFGIFVAFFLEDSAPDPGPVLRTFVIATIISTVAIPILAAIYLIEKVLRHSKRPTT